MNESIIEYIIFSKLSLENTILISEKSDGYYYDYFLTAEGGEIGPYKDLLTARSKAIASIGELKNEDVGEILFLNKGEPIDLILRKIKGA